jgi:hypothetical protein
VPADKMRFASPQEAKVSLYIIVPRPLHPGLGLSIRANLRQCAQLRNGWWNEFGKDEDRLDHIIVTRC